MEIPGPTRMLSADFVAEPLDVEENMLAIDGPITWVDTRKLPLELNDLVPQA